MLSLSLGFCCTILEFKHHHPQSTATFWSIVNTFSFVNNQRKNNVWSVIRTETINVLRKLFTTIQDGTSLTLIHASHWEHCAENINQPENHENSLQIRPLWNYIILASVSICDTEIKINSLQ